jgi:hypothetical protein
MILEMIKKGRRIYYKCRCDCGIEVDVLSDNLNCGKRKSTKSCGCLQKELTALRTRLEPYRNIFNHLLKAARQRNIEVTLSFNDYIDIINNNTNCHYCSTLLVWSEFGGPNRYMGYNIDRKDNDLGYTRDNCVACCDRCNKSKSNIWSYNEWRKMTSCFRSQNELR